MTQKRFHKNLYDKHDPAKKAVCKWLVDAGIPCRVASTGKDRYGVDLIVERPDETYGVEVEQRPDWKGEHFPFKTVHIPWRKLKLMAESTRYAVVNADETWIMAIMCSDILKHGKRVEKKTKYTDNEAFIEIAIGHFGKDRMK